MDLPGISEGHCQDLTQQTVDKGLSQRNLAERCVAQGCNAELALPWLGHLSTNLRDRLFLAEPSSEEKLLRGVRVGKVRERFLVGDGVFCSSFTSRVSCAGTLRRRLAKGIFGDYVIRIGGVQR